MSKRTLKLTISYDGTNYCGWQKQKNGPTIQEEVETQLSTILNIQTNLHGAGRTDAGVHARAMTAHFHTEKSRTVVAVKNGLNSMLPKDIRIINCEEMDDNFHARFSAKAKLYSYHICTSKVQIPTERLYITHVPYILNINDIRSCLDHLLGTHDFSSFEAAGSRDMSITEGRGAVRTLLDAKLTQNDQHLTIFLKGDGFLRHMVRNIAGTLIEVGKGKRNVENFIQVLEAKDRSKGGSTAPAHGLFLEKVFY